METGRPVAIKQMRKQIKATDRCDSGLDEFTYGMLLNKLHHPNILKTFDSVYQDGREHIVLELGTSGDVYDYLNASGEAHLKLGFEAVQRIVLQMASALDYCHREAGVVHSDVKLENFLVHNGAIKLCDFGMVGRIGKVQVGSMLGTEQYMAPELSTIMSRHMAPELSTIMSRRERHSRSNVARLEKSGSNLNDSGYSYSYGDDHSSVGGGGGGGGSSSSEGNAGEDASAHVIHGSFLEPSRDVWSFGIVLYVILFYGLPWEKTRLADPRFRNFVERDGVSDANFPFSMLTPGLVEVMKRALSLDPDNRGSMADIVAFFSEERPWFRENAKGARNADNNPHHPGPTLGTMPWRVPLVVAD